jgi:hypothetical protein
LNWHNLIRGANGVILLYAIVCVAVLAGLLKGRAAFERYLWLPATALMAGIIGVLLGGGVYVVWEVLTRSPVSPVNQELVGVVHMRLWPLRQTKSTRRLQFRASCAMDLLGRSAAAAEGHHADLPGLGRIDRGEQLAQVVVDFMRSTRAA